MFLLSFENGLLYVTYKNAINFWLAKNVRFYCVLPYKTAIGSSWGGGDHIYIMYYQDPDSCVQGCMQSLKTTLSIHFHRFVDLL